MFTEPKTQAATGPHIGAQLKAARETSSLTLADVSKSLNIRKNYLSAIESLDSAALPSVGYVFGFVRAYAKHVGLNDKEAVARYKTDIECPQNMGQSNCPHFVPKRKITIPKGSIAAGVVLALALGFISWYGMKAETSTVLIANATVSETQAWTQTATGVTQDETMISLVAIGPSWVEVSDGQGNILISRIMVPGEIFEVSRTATPLLSVRDAGAIELYLGGQKVGPIGQDGASAKDIPLATAAEVPAAAIVSTSMR